MARVIKEIDIARSPDEVWAIAGDPAGIAAWVPALTGSSVEGDTRTCTLGDGGVITEKLVDRDDAGRSYRYTIVESPFGFSSYESTIEVEATSEGSKVVWTTDMEPDAMADQMAPLYEQSLAGLKQQLES